MKVRRSLARRMAASYACAKRDAAWWGEWFPGYRVRALPLRGRCVVEAKRRPARIPFDIAALRAEVAAGPTWDASHAMGLQVGPTDYHEPRP